MSLNVSAAALEQPEGSGEGEVPGEPGTRTTHAETRRRARSVTASLVVVPAATPDDVPETGTQSDRNEPLDRARETLTALAARSRGLLTGRSLLDIDPPAVGGLWAAHRVAAKRIPWPAVAGARTAWGAVHVLIVTIAYGAGWVLFSPAWTFATALIVTAWILWS